MHCRHCKDQSRQTHLSPPGLQLLPPARQPPLGLGRVALAPRQLLCPRSNGRLGLCGLPQGGRGGLVGLLCLGLPRLDLLLQRGQAVRGGVQLCLPGAASRAGAWRGGGGGKRSRGVGFGSLMLS